MKLDAVICLSLFNCLPLICVPFHRVLHDLISDATVTKQAIDEAHESIENANVVLARSAPVGSLSTTGAPSTFQSAPAPAIAEEDLFGGWGNENSGAVNAPLPAFGSGTFSSAAASSVDESQPSTYNNNPPQVQSESKQPAMSSPMPSYSYNPNPEPTPPAMTTNMYNGGGYTGGSGMGGHSRDLSGNDFGEVMGSSPSHQPPLPTIHQYDSGFGSSMGAQTYDSIPHVTSIKEVEDLKAKSKEADDVAKEAEASRRQIVAQLDELRKLADEAESKVRAASDKPTKKKGILGRGGAAQKKDVVCDFLMLSGLKYCKHAIISHFLLHSSRKKSNDWQWMPVTKRMHCCWLNHS